MQQEQLAKRKLGWKLVVEKGGQTSWKEESHNKIDASPRWRRNKLSKPRRTNNHRWTQARSWWQWGYMDGNTSKPKCRDHPLVLWVQKQGKGCGDIQVLLSLDREVPLYCLDVGMYDHLNYEYHKKEKEGSNDKPTILDMNKIVEGNELVQEAIIILV